jgi:hypothetical protein
MRQPVKNLKYVEGMLAKARQKDVMVVLHPDTVEWLLGLSRPVFPGALSGPCSSTAAALPLFDEPDAVEAADPEPEVEEKPTCKSRRAGRRAAAPKPARTAKQKGAGK